jgi:4-hydroxybenzoate polyprenyltransferase
VEEDNLNKPWRPVPSGRISIMACHAWRWRVVAFCLCLSFLFSFKVLVTSATFAVLVILHDDFGLSGHPILKILCNVGGYASFELGSTLILCMLCFIKRKYITDRINNLAGGSSLDTTCITALSCSALVVLMTILAQDFADVNGDRKLGRRTLPMVAPKGSRIYMLAVFPVLSLGLGSIWSLGPLCTLFFVSIGFGVGLRYFLLRSEVCDQSSFILYNVRTLN